MHRIIVTITFVMLFSSATISAQNTPDAVFGSIPDSLTRVKPPTDNPDIPYMVTNNEVDISFEENNNSIFAILKHHVRLKVFDKTAREASIISIPYYFENDMETISEIKGITYLSPVDKVPLQEGEIRTININERYNVKEFTMPDVEDGAVLEYSYIIKRRYIEELPDFYLSRKVPTSVAKVTITYPNYLRYKPYFQNVDGAIEHNISYTDTSSVPKIFTLPRPDPILTEQWVAYDIPPVNEEIYISSLNDYRGKIKFLLSEFGIPRQQLENSWDVVVARMRKKTNPLMKIQQNGLAKAIGDSIAGANAGKSKEAIQDRIYRFLNDKANFSGDFSAYSEIADSSVIAGKTVNQAAINQTLIAMLQGAGIEAHPVLISSLESGKIDMNFPSFYQFNGQLVQSRIGNQRYIMDASFRHSQPGLIPVNAFSEAGMLLKPNSYKWIEVNANKSIFDIQVELDAALSSSGTLSGKIVSYQKGYPAQLIREQKSDGKSDVEILKRTLFDRFSTTKVSSVEISQLESYDKPVEISARFKIENYAVSFSDGLKFRPMIVGYRAKNPFENTDRDLPITLDAPEKLDVSYSIEVPRGFKVEQGRQNNALSLSGARFDETYSMQSRRLNYEYQIDILQKTFSLQVFPELYNLYQRWVELSNTSWLIKKIR